MNLSKNKIKHIQSLKDKKKRFESKTFVAEGDKMVAELLACLKCQTLVATAEFINTLPRRNEIEEIIEASDSEINSLSFLKNPQNALAVFYQASNQINQSDIDNKLSLALDGIQDPGNFGTIIRLCDWYGIENVFCSKDTVDVYNPKTVQATMGALARVKTHYVDLVEFLSKQEIPIYGTLLDGKSIYEQDLTDNGIIVMGNEGNGIRPEVEKCISKKLYIPHYPKNRETSESLNVGIATGIICAEFRRRYF